MTIKHRPALLDPDGRGEAMQWVELPVGISESEAIERARSVVWPLHRDAVVASRMRYVIGFLKRRPDLDQEVAALLAAPEGMAALSQALALYRRSYSHRDPVRMPTDQAPTVSDQPIRTIRSYSHNGNAPTLDDRAEAIIRRITSEEREVTRFFASGMLQYLDCRLGGHCHCGKSVDERETVKAQGSMLPALELSLKHWQASLEEARTKAISQIRQQWPEGLLVSDAVAAESGASKDAVTLLRELLSAGQPA